MQRCTLLAAWMVLVPLSLGAQEEPIQGDPTENVLIDRVEGGADEEILEGDEAILRMQEDLNKDLHDELRALRDGLVKAINAEDLDKVASYCFDDVRFTAPDATLSRGREGVKKYFLDKTTGPNAVVAAFSTEPVVDDLALLFGGDTAVATGTSTDHFKLTNGMEFDLHTRWSATLVKENGHWLIANYHTATDVFDNPLLNSTKKMLYGAAIAALFVGLVLGMILMVLVTKFRPRKA